MKQTINIIIASLLIVMAACSDNKHREEVCGLYFGSTPKKVVKSLEEQGCFVTDKENKFKIYTIKPGAGFKIAGIFWAQITCKFDAYDGLNEVTFETLRIPSESDIKTMCRELTKQYGEEFHLDLFDTDQRALAWPDSPIHVYYEETDYIATLTFKVSDSRVFEK